jgi:hypothetical protein
VTHFTAAKSDVRTTERILFRQWQICSSARSDFVLDISSGAATTRKVRVSNQQLEWSKMKKCKILAVMALACLSVRAFAIEGLNIAVITNNVILSWPSDPSETYLVQYRHTLDATDSWSTLSDYYPPDYTGLNITYFNDTNIDWGYSPDTGGGGGGMMMMSRMSMSQDDIMEMLMPPGLRTSDSGGRFTADDGGGGTFTPDGGGGGDDDGSSTNQPIAGTGFYQVVRDGVHLVGVTNDMVLSGVVTIPVELGNAYGQLVSLGMSENEDPIGNSVQPYPVQNPHAITLDTTVMPNGVHYIYGSARWEDTNGGLWEADSPTFSVTTSNEITFENWMPTYSELDNTLLIRATSAHTNVDWEIDIYNATNLYLGSFTGNTPDGDIYVTWNLFDYLGNQHTNDQTFHMEVSTPYIDPPVPPTYKVTDPWTSSGAWDFGIQHAFDGLTDVDLLYGEYTYGFFDAAKGSYSVGPSPVGSDPFAIGFQNADEANNWYSFKWTMFYSTVRNLVYFGHGGPNGLGYDQRNTNTSVTVPEIEAALHTVPAGQTNRHAFRFVFLDGCSTAKGTLPEAFGILHKENVSLTDYYNASMRPSCFCGWAADKAVGFIVSGGINYDHVNFVSHIEEDMLMGASIGDAYNYSCSQSDVVTILTSEFKIFGSRDLSFGAYNN